MVFSKANKLCYKHFVKLNYKSTYYYVLFVDFTTQNVTLIEYYFHLYFIWCKTTTIQIDEDHKTFTLFLKCTEYAL